MRKLACMALTYGLMVCNTQAQYELSQYDDDFVACSNIADLQYSSYLEVPELDRVRGSGTRWQDVFRGCMMSKGYLMSN